MILHNTDCEDPMAANIEELINCLKGEKEEIEYNFETIECICKQCQNKTEIKRDSDVFKTKFFRCRKCGYVVGPIINHVPKDYFYIVKDDSNVVEPEKWFGDETDAKDYVVFCGLPESHISRIIANGC